MKLLIAAVIFVSFISPRLLQAADTVEKKPERPPTPVTVAPAGLHSLAPRVSVAGTVISRDDAKIAAELDGRLVSVADIGVRLKKNETLASIDQTFTHEALQENRANSRSLRARLEFATKEVNRLQKLARENAAARNLLDQALADRDVAAGELAAANSRIRQAEERLLRSKITAPFDGIVTERYLQAGEWAERGKAVLRLVSDAQLEVQFRIPVYYLPYVHTGQSLDFMQDGHQGHGIVNTLIPVGDDRSRLYEVRLRLSDSQWQSGQTVQVLVPTAKPRKVMSISRDALVLRRDGIKVFVIDNNLARAVNVTTGVADGELIEIIGQVNEGDAVVIRGGERLRPGEKVQMNEAGS